MRYAPSWGLLAIVSLFTSPQGSCQEPASHEFFPLEIGNVWIHQYSVDGAGYRTTEVTGTTVHEGHPAWLVEVEYEPFDGSDGSSATCAFRVTDDDLLVTSAIEGDETVCRPMARGADIEIDLSDPPITEQNVWIAATEHTLETRSYSLGDAFVGLLASGVGLVTSFPWISTNFPDKHLVYAKIGEDIIGIHPDDYAWRTFHPLVVDNEWLYRYTSINMQGTSTTYRHLKVIGVEAIGDDDIFEVDLRVFDDEGELISHQICTITRTSAGVDVASGTSPCSTYPGDLLSALYSQLSFRQYGTSRPDNLNDFGTREIIRYAFAVTGTDSYQTWARDLGLVRDRHLYAYGPGSSHFTIDLILLWASIDGFEYGTVPPWLVLSDGGGDGPPLGATELQVFPNPVISSDVLQLEGWGAACGGGGELYDMLGRRVMQIVVVSDATPCRLELDLSVVSAGVYILRWTTAEEVLIRRITVID